MNAAVTYALWVAPITALACIIVRKALKDTFRQYPFFLAYAAGVVAGSIVEIYLYHSHISYMQFFTAYWAEQTILVLLSYAAIYEVFKKLLSRYTAITPLSKNLLFFMTAVLLLGVGAWAANWSATFVQTVLMLQQACRLLQVAMLIVIFALAMFFGLQWRQNAFGIALGFGLYGSVGLIDLTLRRWNMIGADAFTRIDAFAYNCVALLWLAYLYYPERQPVTRVLPATSINDWNQALGELLQR